MGCRHSTPEGRSTARQRINTQKEERQNSPLMDDENGDNDLQTVPDSVVNQSFGVLNIFVCV